MRFAALVLAGLLLAGCGRGGRPVLDTTQAGPDPSAIVVRGSEMTGVLLDGMRARVPTMTVTMNPGGCPQLVLRGRRSAQNQGNPTVYVDGTLMRDTCILMQIPAVDVDYVEIFPGGAVPRPGVQRNPFGTIFVHRVQR